MASLIPLHNTIDLVRAIPKELDLNLDGDRARKVSLALSNLFF